MQHQYGKEAPVDAAMTTKGTSVIGAASSYQGDTEKGCTVMSFQDI